MGINTHELLIAALEEKMDRLETENKQLSNSNYKLRNKIAELANELGLYEDLCGSSVGNS